MVRNLSQILGILVLTGMFPSEKVYAMEEEHRDSPHASRLAKNVENETKKAGEKTGKVLGKAVGQTEKAGEKAAGQTEAAVTKAAGQTEATIKKAGGQIGDGLRKFAGHFRKKK